MPDFVGEQTLTVRNFHEEPYERGGMSGKFRNPLDGKCLVKQANHDAVLADINFTCKTTESALNHLNKLAQIVPDTSTMVKFSGCC